MARAAPKYPRELNALIVAEANAGTGPTAILRMIRKGELDGMNGPVPMPDGTFWDRWRKLKRHIEPASRVPEGEEMASLDNLEREIIRMLDREAARLQKEQRKGRLTTGDVATLRQLGRTVSELKRAMSPTKGKGKQAAATEANRDASRSPLQDRAARFLEREQGDAIDRNEDRPASDPKSMEAGNGNGAALSEEVREAVDLGGPSSAQPRVSPAPARTPG